MLLERDIRFLTSALLLLLLSGSGRPQILPPGNFTNFEGRNSTMAMDLLRIAARMMQEGGQGNNRDATRRIGPDAVPDRPMDCADIVERGRGERSGVYRVWPRNRVIRGSINVYCDMDDDGGAWTVIQRRGDFDSPRDYFYQDWVTYKNGFGNPLTDFWLGNDNIFALTNQRFNLIKFTLSDWEGNTTYATYDEFWMDDEYHNYTVHVKGYRGTAGDSFSATNGTPFTTRDRDNDLHENNCAIVFKGAWWYRSCHSSNLNGMYLRGPHNSYADGVEWEGFRGHYYSLMNSTIKIRPKDFNQMNIILQ